MDRLARRLRRRIEALERRLGALPPPVGSEEVAKRRTRTTKLCAAAVEGREPEDLTPEEREHFAELLVYAPVYLELLQEGALDHYGELHRCGLRDEDTDRDVRPDGLHDEDPRNDDIDNGS